jgi:hypothetical protein
MKPQITTLKTLFEAKKGIENLGTFLIKTEIATRKVDSGRFRRNR